MWGCVYRALGGFAGFYPSGLGKLVRNVFGKLYKAWGYSPSAPKRLKLKEINLQTPFASP